MIFVHELGHFLAARLIGVRVEVFSLGFGPRLLGIRRKGTLYQIAAIPMGGYVAVAGEDPNVRGPRTDELPSKSVAQRFLYYSGGVLMNLAFAVVVLPLVFLYGVSFVKPVLGDPVVGGPAWEAGIPAGAEVLAVNGAHVYDFLHVPTAVALGPKEGSRLDLRLPDGTETAVTVVPRKRPDLGLWSIDVRPAIDPRGTVVVPDGSPAAASGLVDGDSLVAVEGMPAELSLRDQLAWVQTGGGPMALLVRGADPDSPLRRVEIAPTVTPSKQPRVGIAPPFHAIEAIRDTERGRATGLRAGDRVLAIEGRPIWRSGDAQLAILDAAPGGARSALTLLVARGDATHEITWPAWTREELAAVIGEIAWTQREDGAYIAVYEGEAGALGGLADGDRVLAIDGKPVARWSDVKEAVQAARGSDMHFRVERDGEVIERVVTPIPGPLVDYGFSLATHSYVFRTASVGEAVRVGLASSFRFLQEVWLSLQKLILREVPADSLGGIIQISVVSYTWAESGVAKLFFFLCLLSINLAFINVLPIPVLDGGHLFFLGIEAVKGSPVSEKVFGYSQMVGLVLIVTLMVYVTFNDLMRLLQ